MKQGILALATVAACFLVGTAAAADNANAMRPTQQQMKMIMTPNGPQHPAGMPAGVAPYLGCIPTMGYHYADPKNLPFGPIYGWYHGQLTFTEIMVDKKLFEAGTNWNEVLKPLPGHTIDHVDIWYEAHGHPGYTIPHYDIHAWYIPRSKYMYFCGNSSGKRPVWL